MENNLPHKEASGKSPLNGTYKVSFNVDVETGDEFSLSDLAQVISTGFGEGLMDRVSHLKVEKMAKEGAIPLKAGDTVYLTRTIKVSAQILDDNGYFFVGSSTEDSREMGTQEITLTEGSTGIVNQVKDGKVEIIDLDRTSFAELVDPETNDFFEDAVNIDLIAIDLDAVEKVTEE